MPSVLGHLRWMASWLFRRDRMAWVVEAGRFIWISNFGNLCRIPIQEGTGLARVRWTPVGAVVSIEVMPEHRGHGVGLFGVQVATKYAEVHGWGRPTAYIRADNGPSIGLFAKAGYEMVGARDELVTMARP